MADYLVFGGTLRCDLDFAGVPRAPRSVTPDWRLRVSRKRPGSRTGLRSNPKLTAESSSVMLHQLADGWRLSYPDTGTYDVSGDGSQITWYPGEEPSPELVQADLLGRVLALALSAAGALPLHGSAVTFGGGGIVILGEKHQGKSTLAGALMTGGAKLVSDDMAALEPGRPVRLRPGVPQLRLWPQGVLPLPGDSTASVAAGMKNTWFEFGDDRVENATKPLRAIYVLQARPAGPDLAGAERVPLAASPATLELLVHAKLGVLLTGSIAATHLARVAEVVRTVPVYRLLLVRDPERIGAVATQIKQWHEADLGGS